jgi:indolepyruvate ferredoxin oxidoreductase beta subunit
MISERGNIIFCGVGGQGILLASEITSLTLLKAGFDVKKSEVHGMAQRGGSVTAHLRYGPRVYSPLIEPGTADIEVAFELIESVRYLPYLNPGSSVIVNTQKILPPPVTTGIAAYPEDALEQLRRRKLSVFPVDAFSIARSIGETRAVNMVLVGALSTLLPFETSLFLRTIDDRIPEKIRELNRQAFLQGQKAIQGLKDI